MYNNSSINNVSLTKLYSSFTSIESHSVRFIIEEKQIDADIIYEGDPQVNKLEDLLDDNGNLMSPPIVFNKDICISDFVVILEYLDERFPLQKLYSFDPVEKAQQRTQLLRFCIGENSLYGLYYKLIGSKDPKIVEEASGRLVNSLIELLPLFQYQLEQEEFGITEVILSVLLWRIQGLKAVKLPRTARPIKLYAHEVFSRPSFQSSLTANEEKYRTVTA